MKLLPAVLDDKFYVNNLGETPLDDGDAPLPKAEAKVMEKWEELSGLSDALFKIQGRIRETVDGGERSEITLTTEFKHKAEDNDVWNKIYRFARWSLGHVEWEFTAPELEHSWKTYQRGPKKGEKIPGSDKYGPLHGVLCRQVGLVWVYPLKVEKAPLKRFIKRVNDAIRLEGLDKYWVAVY